MCICLPGFRKDNGTCKGTPSYNKYFLTLSIKLLHLKILTYRQTTFTDSICQEQHFCAEGF